MKGCDAMNNLEFAINMELDGEKFYLDQAEKNENTGLKSVFSLLADEERAHAKLLQDKLNELPYELNDTYGEFRNVFQEADDFQLTGMNAQSIDAFRQALEKEKDSIELYEKALADSENDQDKELFMFLVHQEKNHYEMMDKLIILLDRPNEWVEAAEFGLREEY